MNFYYKAVFVLIISIFILFDLNAQCNLQIDYKLDGYVLDIFCFEDSYQPYLALEIESISGGSGVYAVEAAGNCHLSNTLVTSGGGFTLYISEEAHTDQNFGFLISDGDQNTCSIDQTVAYQLNFIPFLCTEQACNSEISASFESGMHLDYFNCSTDTLVLKVDDVTGGDGSFIVSSLGLGELDLNNFQMDNSFTLRVSQADIDAELSQVGFVIDDENGCQKRFDFSGSLAFNDLASLCGLVDLQDQLIQEIDIYPNLVDQYIKIINKEDLAISKITIFNISGQAVFNDLGGNNIYDLSNLNKGIYNVLLETEKGMIVKRIVKN